MVAIPIPETTYSHWSAPRWRLCGPPSAFPGSKTISAACELGLPRTMRNPISNCRFFRFIHFSHLIHYRNLTAEKQRRFARRGGAVESASKQDERHIGGSRYPAAFKTRHYWFGLDSGLLDSESGPE